MLQQIQPLLQVQDLDLSVTFYCEQLGFSGGVVDEGFAMVSRDQCTIYLAQKTKSVDVTNKAARKVVDGWCNYDFLIQCKHGTLDALHKEFTDNGVEWLDCFQNGPEDRPYGMRDFSVFDPDGYDLVFAEPTEN